MGGWLSIYAFGPTSDASFCAERNCVWSFPITNPINGTHWIVALPLPLVIFVGVMIIFLVVNAFDFCVRVLSTRYNPRCMFFVYYGLLKSMFVVPYFVYVQYWALYDYFWGGAKFIATARSPLSPRKEAEGLGKTSLEVVFFPFAFEPVDPFNLCSVSECDF